MNRFGLDVNYHQPNLRMLADRIDNYTPQEYARTLLRLVVASSPIVMSESEFTKARMDAAFKEFIEGDSNE